MNRSDVREWARVYAERGWKLIPIPPREKAPRLKDWQRGLPNEEVLNHLTADSNLGVLLGAPSGTLIDIDIDAPDALPFAEQFLPPTVCVFGRANKPRSHRLYCVDTDTRTVRFQCSEGTLVELRGTGAQTVFPPSIHPSGERIEWDSWGEPAQVSLAELKRAVACVAGATLLARHWRNGTRHALALAVAAVLARGGWSEQEAIAMVDTICDAVGDTEQEDRLRAVRDTYEKHRRREPIAGVSQLVELIGEADAQKVVEWLAPEAKRGRELQQEPTEEKHERKPASARVLVYAEPHIRELFHTPDETAYATLEVGGHCETHRLNSPAFRSWLARLYFEREGTPIYADALRDAIAVLEARARFEGTQRDVSVRVGGAIPDAVYLDLCTPDWRIVECTPNGWRVIPYSDCPVRFERVRGALPLPTPARGGSIEDLRAFLRVSDTDFVLVAGWLLACLAPNIPYPILALSGEQGAGKSTTTRILRSLIDPREPASQSPPKTEEDLIVSARASHLVAIDNLSRIGERLSDALCRLATGGGLEKRQLYTDSETTLLTVRKPLILNSISDIATRPDLADRIISIELQPLADTEREPEAQLWNRFEQVRPRILGALLDAVCEALRHWNHVHLPVLPRMADATLWVSAGETAFGWSAGTFVNAYTANRQQAVESLAEADPVVGAVVKLMSDRNEWKGTASELYTALLEQVPEAERSAFPRNPVALSVRRKRINPLLRRCGIEWSIERERHANLQYLSKPAINPPHLPHLPHAPERERHANLQYLSKPAINPPHLPHLPHAPESELNLGFQSVEGSPPSVEGSPPSVEGSPSTAEPILTQSGECGGCGRLNPHLTETVLVDCPAVPPSPPKELGYAWQRLQSSAVRRVIGERLARYTLPDQTLPAQDLLYCTGAIAGVYRELGFGTLRNWKDFCFALPEAQARALLTELATLWSEQRNGSAQTVQRNA